MLAVFRPKACTPVAGAWSESSSDTPGLFLVIPQPERLLVRSRTETSRYLLRMASTLTKILLHITFSTKDRVPTIPESREPVLYSYIGGICRRMNSPLLAMGGTADHVHMMVSMSKTIALSILLMEVKRDSSKWIKERDASLRTFGWQDGYFGFSIGESEVEALRAYSANQKSHHTTVDFKVEIRMFLQKYGIEGLDRQFRGCRRKASSTPRLLTIKPFGLKDSSPSRTPDTPSQTPPSSHTHKTRTAPAESGNTRPPPTSSTPRPASLPAPPPHTATCSPAARSKSA